jgi:nucleotide-binding universal stress UspA family protein
MVYAERDNSHKLNVLAVVEEADTTRQCLIAATQAVAVDPHGLLTALHIEVDPAHIRTAPEEISLQQLRIPQEGSSHDRAIQIQRIFEFWAYANPKLAVTWRTSVGTIDATLTKQAAQADLIVICQPHNLDSTDALHAAIFHSGKPVLFVPRGPLRDISLGHLAIAWKDTPQANKAVQQSRPWLAAAERVSALVVEEHAGAHNTERLQQLLDDFGIRFDLHRLLAEGETHVAASLLQAADRIQADALVMGAYRFGQVLEWIFGGVTSEVLKDCPRPVFLAH